MKKYNVLEISQEMLEKILYGKIRKFDELRDEYENQKKKDLSNISGQADSYVSSFKYLILYRWENDDTINDSVSIIETIFIK